MVAYGWRIFNLKGQSSTTLTNVTLPAVRTPPSANPVLVYLGRLPSPRSRRTMGRGLDVIATMLVPSLPEQLDTEGNILPGQQAALLGQAWGGLRYQFTAKLQADLMGRYSPATVNTYMSALRGVLKEAWRLGYMNAEDYQRAVDIQGISGEALPAGRDLAPGEIKALLDACSTDKHAAAGTRDAALIAVLYAGARRAEVARLLLEDYTPATGELRIISGKGRKSRRTYVDPGGLLALSDWLRCRGQEPGPLFLPVDQKGRIEYRDAHIAPQTVYDVLARRGKQAGLAPFSPHDFRRTVIGDLLDAGIDIAIVARMMGHANVETTKRYDRRPEQVKRNAAGMIRLPYRGRE